MKAPLVSPTKLGVIQKELKAIAKQLPLHLKEIMRRSNFNDQATNSQILEVIADDYPHILSMVKA